MRFVSVALLLFLLPLRAWGAACSNTAAGSTALEKAANGLSAGQWCEMTPAMLNFTPSAVNIKEVLDTCNAASHVAQYANNMAYDASQGTAGKIFWWGSGHGGTYRGIVYDIADNPFTLGPDLSAFCTVGGSFTPDWEGTSQNWCSPAGGIPHANDGITDDNNGHFFYAAYNSQSIARFTLPSTVQSAWETSPIGLGTGAIDFWPQYGTIGSFVVIAGGNSPHNVLNLYNLSTDTWTQPFSPLSFDDANNGNLNSTVLYNNGSHEVLIGDGNNGNNSWRLRLVGSTPTLTQNADAPITLSFPGTKNVDDPVSPSGKFIFWNQSGDTVGTSSNGWYEYNQATNTWSTFASLGINSMPPLWSISIRSR